MTSNADIEVLIRDVPDFPKPGIVFKDITPLLADPAGLQAAIQAMTEPFRSVGVTKVAAAEARGFLFGVAMAIELGVGFVPVRKPGKLPSAIYEATYELEYGTDTVQLHRDAAGPDDRVLLVDDLLATGGTMAACIELIERTGASVVGCSFLIDLTFLNGRSRLGDVPVEAVLRY